MDDLTFQARRESAATPRQIDPPDIETRFRNLVQSPLRAGLLRYLNASPEQSFVYATINALAQPVMAYVNEIGWAGSGVGRAAASLQPQPEFT